MDKRIVIIVSLPYALFLLAWILALFIPLEMELTATERRILNYKPDKMFKKFIEKLEYKPAELMAVDFNNPFTFAIPEIPEQPKPVEILPGLDLTGEPEFDEASYSVTAIVIGNEKRYAVINGVLVKEGSTLDGYEVKKIDKKRVFLIVGDRPRWIHLESFKPE